MESLFDNEELSDVKLHLVERGTSRKKMIYAHKQILANVAPFFRKMFSSSARESQIGTVELKVDDLDATLELIEWIYTRDNEIPQGSEDQAEVWSIVEPNGELPYPGKSGTFVFDANASRYRDVRGRSRLNYNSQTEDSLLKEVVFWKNGNEFEVYYIPQKGKGSQLHEYFAQYDIPIDKYYALGLSTDNSEEAKIVATLILQNNTFPEVEIEKIQKFFNNEINPKKKVPIVRTLESESKWKEVRSFTESPRSASLKSEYTYEPIWRKINPVSGEEELPSPYPPKYNKLVQIEEMGGNRIKGELIKSHRPFPREGEIFPPIFSDIDDTLPWPRRDPLLRPDGEEEPEELKEELGESEELEEPEEEPEIESRMVEVD